MLSKNQLRKVIESANTQLKNVNLKDLEARQRLVMLRESAYTAVKLIQAGKSADAEQVIVSAGIQSLDHSPKGYRSTFLKQADILETGKYAVWHKKRVLSKLPLNTAGVRRVTPVQTGIKAAVTAVRNTTRTKEASTDALAYLGQSLALERAARANEGTRKGKAAANKAAKLLKLAQAASTSQDAAVIAISKHQRDSLGYSREMTYPGKRATL